MPALLWVAAGCGSMIDDRAEAPEATPTVDSRARDRPDEAAASRAPAPGCRGARLPVWRDGDLDGDVCEADAATAGLTIVDLSDDWTPRIFREDASLGATGRSSYHDTYVVHAAERHPEGTPAWRRRRPPARFLELYGIFPTLGVLRARFADAARHRCHEDVDDAALAEVEGILRPRSHGGRGAQRRRAGWVARTERVLEEVREARGLEAIGALADDPRWGPKLRRLRELRRPVDAIAATQAHLRCDRLLRDDAVPAVFDRPTLGGLGRWQQKHMIVSNGVLDEDTRQALLRGSLENDYRALLRVLRERVADAAGLIADGTAAGEVGTVLGRLLDPPELRVTADEPPLPDAAPDAISPATEAAARALGWTDAESARVWLEALPADGTGSLRVALPLPPRPPWQGDGGTLDVVARLDRGDVSYAFPFFDDGRPRWRPIRVRPTLRVLVRHQGREIPLVRWSTTIGGWHQETAPDGEVGLAYKNSPVGPRVWRDVIAAPTWMPPPATPDAQLLRNGQSLMGPGYESAFGLVMIQHDRVYGASVEDVVAGRHREGDLAPVDEGDPRPVRLSDEGIRTHGSVSYRSVLSGESHGCHRLFNHLAVRLAGWLLTHRPHVRRGPQAARYRRELYDPEHPADVVELAVDSRGDVFELTPPVEIVVEEGRVRGRPRRPIDEVLPIPKPPASEGDGEG